MVRGRAIGLAFGIAVAMLGAWVWIYSGTFPQLPEGYPGPSLFPRIIAAGLVLCGLYLVAMALARSDDDVANAALEVSRAGLFRFALALGIIAAYPLLRGWLGFVPTVALFVFTVSFSLGTRFRYAVLTAVITSTAIYYVFTSLLRVPF